jgi:hypothetical protein
MIEVSCVKKGRKVLWRSGGLNETGKLTGRMIRRNTITGSAFVVEAEVRQGIFPFTTKTWQPIDNLDIIYQDVCELTAAIMETPGN